MIKMRPNKERVHTGLNSHKVYFERNRTQKRNACMYVERSHNKYVLRYEEEERTHPLLASCLTPWVSTHPAEPIIDYLYGFT